MKQLVFKYLILLTFSYGIPVFADSEPYSIGILMWHDVEHDLDAVAGFKDGLEFSGIKYEIDLKNANENLQAARKILTRWESQGIDLVFAVGTKATLIAQQQLIHTPIVFSAVTSPITTGIIKSWSRPGGNTTGTSNWVKLEDKLRLFKKAMASLRSLGVIYNLQNPVSVTEVAAAGPAAKIEGIKLKKATISGPHQIEEAIEDLLSRGIDALWIPIEKDVYSNMDIVARVSTKYRLPVFSSTMKGVELTSTGQSVGIVGITVDYHKLGYRSVFHAVDILSRGTNPGDIPVETLPPLVIANLNSATNIDFTIPSLFLARSDHVISGFDNQKITVGGTGDSQQLIQKLAQTLLKKLKGGDIEVPDSIGSSGGIRALAEDRIDLARTARPLRQNEKRQGLSERIFAYTPVVFATHPSVTAIDNLSSQEVLDIYSGKIKNWVDVGSIDHKIYVVTREPGDSSLTILQEKLEGFKNINSSHAKTIYNTRDTIEALKNHRFTIGFATYSEIKNSKLRVMKLDGVFPSIENILNGRYKLMTPLSVVYKQEPTGLVRSFTDFLFSEEGKKIITDFGSIPISP